MKNRRNYYRILHVQPDAPLAVIRSSYKTIMQKLRVHPDLGGDTAKALLINEAYETLSDSEKRRQYDQGQSSWHKRLKHQKSESTLRSGGGSSKGNGGVREDITFKRAIKRMAQKGDIKLLIHGQPNAILGRICDLSPKGMRFIANINLKVGLVIKIEGQMMDAVARVTSCVPDGSRAHNQFAIGVEFISVNFSETKGSFVSSAV